MVHYLFLFIMSEKKYLDADGLDHYHKGISDILDKNLNGDFVENNEFTFRATDGITSIKTGTAYLERIKGNTVKWNQLLRANKLVDMGLPSGTLWATCNIDVAQDDGFAESPYQYECSFFSWGNIDGHNPISNNAFDYDFGGVNASEPYYDGQPYGETQGNTLTSNIPQNADYDAARHHLCASWRMPTSAEFNELFANTKFINADGTEIDESVTDKKVIVNGIRGIYLESNINGARLFFSCSGYGNGTIWNYRGSYGNYWSSTWETDRGARGLRFYSGGVTPQNNNNRNRGFSIRPVTNSAIVTDENGHKYAVSGKYIIDLTIMYGEGNEPSTIAQLEADYFKWFGKPLTSEGYTEGELRDVKMSAIKTIGFNAFNLATGKAKLLGGQEYEVVGTYTGLTIDGESVTLVDGKFTPAQSCELVVTGGDSTTCVHLVHSGKRNGESEAYWEQTKNVPISTLTGKLNGEGESVIVFPDGMKSAGSVHDEIYIENGKTYAIKRMGSVDLGTLTWAYRNESEPYIFGTPSITNYKKASSIIALCSKYEIRNGAAGSIDNARGENKKGVFYYNVAAPTLNHFYVRDDDYTDATAFTAAMQGVMLYYELATPLVYELDNFQLPLPYRVDDYGTEEVLGAENSVAPTLDIRYGINIIDTIRNLPKTIESIETEISDANDSIDDAFDAIDAKEDKLAFSHSTSEVPPSTATTFAPQVNHIYYQHETSPVIGNINMVLPVPTTERATIKIIYRNSTSDTPTITSAEGVNVIIESNIGGPYRLTTINCEWYHDCWVVDIQTHGT